MTPDSPEYRAFIRAICLEPLDDLSRLKFADFLDENAGTVACGKCPIPDPYLKLAIQRAGAGKIVACSNCSGSGRISNGNAERAEFIRIQISLDALTNSYDSRIYERNRAVSGLHYEEIFAMRDREDSWLKAKPHPGFVVSNQNFATDKPQMIYARGFVSEIRCTLARFVGGSCQVCGNVGAVMYCYSCHGTGRTPGIAAKVFAEHPLTSVVLTDREPYRGIDNNTGQFWWLLAADNWNNSGDDGTWLPEELWNLLYVGPKGYRRAITYPSREIALAALNAACVSYGRSLAQLPPLPGMVAHSHNFRPLRW